MDNVNVVLLIPVTPLNQSQIQAVSPRLNIIDASPLMPRLLPDQNPPGPSAEQELDRRLAQAEILYGFRFPPHIVSRAPRLKWMQAVSAGVEQVLTAEIAASQVILTNVSGIHMVPISELVFGLILSYTKKLGRAAHNQKNKQWDRYSSTTLDGKTLGILGLGHIGRRISRIARALGMRVVATRRHVRQMGRARYVDAVYPRERLLDMLAECDFVVDCLPLTSETLNFIGEKELRAMKSTAFLVNIGRGSTIDESALVQALQKKWIAGAGLDTFQQEPLPPESPLWDLPDVIITPHMSGSTDDYMNKAAAVFCDNLKHYLSGRRLNNIVDKKLGY
jgi:D-2-hydroxyacid dehydrogenase (NADP+)